jgi:hypothetical protein
MELWRLHRALIRRVLFLDPSPKGPKAMRLALEHWTGADPKANTLVYRLEQVFAAIAQETEDTTDDAYALWWYYLDWLDDHYPHGEQVKDFQPFTWYIPYGRHPTITYIPVRCYCWVYHTALLPIGKRSQWVSLTEAEQEDYLLGEHTTLEALYKAYQSGRLARYGSSLIAEER